MEKIYEKTSSIIIIIIILLGAIILFVKELNSNKILIYKNYSATVVKKDLVMTIVSKKDLEIIYKNKYMFLENKKKEIKIRKIEKDVLTRKDIKYSALYLDLELNKNSKENDVVELAIIEDKTSFIDIIKRNWKGVIN